MDILNIIRSKYIGTFNLYEQTTTTNTTTFIDEPTLSLNESLQNVPCRLSYDKSTIAISEDGVPYINQVITLILDPDKNIPAGSIIEITQLGVTKKFKSSSEQKIYTYHQEIELENYEDYA